MEPENKQSSILRHKTTQAILYAGALGWTAFALTGSIWINQSKNSKKSLSSQSEEISALKTQIEADTSAAKTKLEKQETQLKKNSEKLKTLTKELDESQSARLALQSKYSNEVAKLHEQRRRLLEKSHQVFDQLPLNKENLDSWATFLGTEKFSDEKLNNALYSKLAEKYFQLGDYVETKRFLALSDNHSPEQITRIQRSLNLQTVFSDLEKAFKQKQPRKELEEKMKRARLLLNPLANKPDKKDTYTELSSKLLQFETQLVLQSPPKEALASLLKLNNQLANKSVTPNFTLAERVHFLNTTTTAYSLSIALGKTKDIALLRNSITAGAKLVEAKDKNHKSIPQAKATVALIELDALFAEGDATQISKKAAELTAIAEKCSAEDKIIYTAAAAGHRSAVLFEQGRITDGRNLLNKAIDKLRTLCDKSPDLTSAHFRLGILYWLQAQLTTSKEVSFKSLNDAIAVLTPLSKNAPVTKARQIRQFSAMVEGDLGHLLSTLNKKEDAKKHFTSALAHWNKIVANWGATEETKEGIDYCTWRIKQL